MISKEKLEQLMVQTDSDVDLAKAISDSIVAEKAEALDSLMRDIQYNIVNVDNPADSVIEYYFMQLTNALYFINTQIEYHGFYEDITKANFKLKYNEQYTEKQLLNAENNIKGTVADLQMYAERTSMDEQMLHLIYSRSVSILKGKVNAAGEMIRTLSKILTAHMNEAYVTRAPKQFAE